MYLTEQDVRDFIQDRNAADNDGMDLSYSPEDLKSAMRRAAREYNSIPPLFIRLDDMDHLPGETNMFLDATAEQLFISEYNRLTRSDIDYTAGGVVTPIDRKRIEYLQQLIKMHGERWRDVAKTHKLQINYARGYRHF
jgi:hypothetical protein